MQSGFGATTLSDPLLQPFDNFALDPCDPARSEMNAFGELPGLFQTIDVCWGVEDQRP